MTHGDSLSARNQARSGEQGYLLVMAGVLIIVVTFLLSSLTFVMQRDSSYKENYATGERLAEMATMAHFYAQQLRYSASPPINSLDSNCTIATDMNMPDNFSLLRKSNAFFEIQICGANDAPVNASIPNNIKAASAYLLLRFRERKRGMFGVWITQAADRRPSDNMALLAGATTRGMSRAGFVDLNVGANCDGEATRVRWGPDDSACLNGTQITNLRFTNWQRGDLIIPVWETALARANNDVIYRFPQPARPDMSSMNMPLRFRTSTTGSNNCLNPNFQCMTGVGETRADNVRADPATNDMTGTNNIQRLDVRYGSTTDFSSTAPVTATNTVFINDQDGGDPVMTVAGPVDLMDSTVNVVEQLHGGVTVQSNSDVDVALIGANPGGWGQTTPFATTVDLNQDGDASTTGLASIDEFTGTVGNLNLNNATQSINIAGTLDTTATTISNGGAALPIYAGLLEMRAGGTATVNVINDGNPATTEWSIGSVEQRGNSSTTALRVNVLDLSEAADDCIGRACPNYVRDPPPDGPF